MQQNIGSGAAGLVDMVEDWDKLPYSPLVSVALTAYNHERFIVQALDSVLMQKVEFPFEIVVGDDKSTDSTRAIVADYQDRLPDKIRLCLSKQNLYSMRPKLPSPVRAACRGKYIALLEGDDYWTDPLKLQIQVDLLESHSDCALCFHNVLICDDGMESKIVLAYPSGLQPWHFLEDIAEHNFIYTASVMCRSSAMPLLPPLWSRSLAMGDWPNWVLCAQRGSLGYVDRVMATYRRHAGGSWSAQSFVKVREDIIHASEVMERELGLRSARMAAHRNVCRKDAIGQLIADNDYPHAAFHALRLLRPLTGQYFAEIRRLIGVILRGRLPALWNCFLKLKRRVPWRSRVGSCSVER